MCFRSAVYKRIMADKIKLLDDSTRPAGPSFDSITEAQRLPGRHLVMIHEHFRGQMRFLRTIIEQAGTGDSTPEDIQAEVEKLPMLENYRRFGNLCGQHCRVIEMHHMIEDQAIFPELSSKDKAMKNVVDRLIAEHGVVHEVLTKLVDALNALITTPEVQGYARTVEIYATLETILLSHFDYEETQLGDALGYYDISI